MKTEIAIIEIKCEEKDCSTIIKPGELYYIKFKPKKNIFLSSFGPETIRQRICKKCASKYARNNGERKYDQLNLFKNKFVTLERGIR